MKNRIFIATLTGAILGILCIIGVGFRLGFAGNELFLFATWFNRVLMGFAIGLAEPIKFTKNRNYILRGLFFGLIFGFALYISSGAIDLMGFGAAIVYGLIIDYFATHSKEQGFLAKTFHKKEKKMPIYIIALIVILVLFLLWIAFGYFGSKVEQLGYTVLDSSKEYEIRQLDDHIIAETEVKGGFDTASSQGFTIIAGYIFGDNKSKEKIAMTSPVVESEKIDMTAPVINSEKIAMTTPVIQEEKADNISYLSFVLPSKYTLETLPDPIDSRIKIREVKSKKIAALRFSGFYSDKTFEEKKDELKKYLERDGLSYENMYSAGYNPPWTPPFMRKLEVWADLN